jgi:hypothetical protein
MRAFIFLFVGFFWLILNFHALERIFHKNFQHVKAVKLLKGAELNVLMDINILLPPKFA